MTDSVNPSILAWVALLGWPIVAFVLVKKYEVQRAVILAILIPYLFLPLRVKLDVPGLPGITKAIIPGIAIVFALMAAKHRFLELPKPLFLRVVLLLLFIFPILTWFTNREALVLPAKFIPGEGFPDIVHNTFINFTTVYVPFMLGYKYLARPADHELLVRIILTFGLIYSVFVLWEVRFSPQLHRNLYGFFPHDWRQMVRYGGFRPVVFLGHGLVVALYMALALLCAFTVWRNAERKKKGKALLCFLYLSGVLFLCKSAGSLILSVLFLGLIWFTGRRLQLKLLNYLMIVVILFPVFRSSPYYPDQWLYETAASFDEDRAQSLGYRFNMENQLIERTAEKSLFGWGGWGRNFIYHERTGESLIVVDGFWIIAYSKFGWVGYVALFCLYAFPVMVQARFAKRSKKLELSPYTLCLCCLLALNLMDSLVNASMSIFSALIAGAVWANAHLPAEARAKVTKKKPVATTEEAAPQPV